MDAPARPHDVRAVFLREHGDTIYEPLLLWPSKVTVNVSPVDKLDRRTVCGSMHGE